MIVGTAGHIDHGKTTLVEKLTGIRTDRLPEEKERGMTIDVGYAEFRLPDGTEVGLIDVPGHERLVRTMVAGATAMDLALLVVAADDGPMLQTREHVDILDLLGVRRAVVAMTKTDLVGADHQDLVEEEIREMLAGTTLEGAPILRVSSATGAGIDELKRVIAEAIPPMDVRGEDPRAFRMPILRAFVAPGRGTVVTGIPVAGRIADGDAVEVMPPKWGCRVRGIQVHHRDATEARAGHRAALALTDVQAERIQRGMVVAAAGTLEVSPRFSARLRVLSRLKEPLEHGMGVRVHVGADQVPSRLHLLEADKAEPGSVTAVELQGVRPFLVVPGDRFVLRSENAEATFGGGIVVERLSARLPRRRQGIVSSIVERAAHVDEPDALVAATVRNAGERGAEAADVALATGLRLAVVPAAVDRLVAAGTVVRPGRGARAFDAEAFRQLKRRVAEAVTALHKKDAAMPFLPLSAVRTAVGRVEPTAFDVVLDDLVKAGDLRRSPEGGIASKSHGAVMSKDEKERCDRILQALEAGKGMPPDEEEMAATLGIPPHLLKKSLLLLEARKEVFRASPFWFHGGWLAGIKAKMAEHVKAKGPFTAGEGRELAGTTRKFVIPLLEALDDKGFTRRVGDKRVVV